MKLSDLNELACKDFIFLINTSFSFGKVAFDLVKNVKSADFLEGICKIVWDRLVTKYALHTSLPLPKLKANSNSKLESIEKDPHKWLLNLEWLTSLG